MKKVIFLVIVILSFNNLYSQQVDEFGEVIDGNETPLENQNENLESVSVNPANVIHSIPSPTGSTLDIAYDGENLWLASASQSTLFMISPADGTVLKEFVLDSDYLAGLTFDGTNLWVSDRGTMRIVQVDPVTGDILLEFPMDTDKAGGLAWENSSLWHNNNLQGNSPLDTTFQISSTTGDILDYYLPVGTQPTGLTFDGAYLWSADNETDRIYKMYLFDYTAIDSIDAPGGSFPNGLAYDGEFLWVANNESDSIYQVDVAGTVLSLNDPKNIEQQFLVSPNPSSSDFVFSNTANRAGLEIQVFTLNGQLINTVFMEKDNTIVSLESEPSGLYFYIVKGTRGIIESGRLIKD